MPPKGPAKWVYAPLGAGRGRMVRQLLTETMLVGVGGFAVGVVLSVPFVRLLPKLNSGKHSAAERSISGVRGLGPGTRVHHGSRRGCSSHFCLACASMTDSCRDGSTLLVLCGFMAAILRPPSIPCRHCGRNRKGRARVPWDRALTFERICQIGCSICAAPWVKS